MPSWLTPVLQWGDLALAVLSTAALIYVLGVLMPAAEGEGIHLNFAAKLSNNVGPPQIAERRIYWAKGKTYDTDTLHARCTAAGGGLAASTGKHQ